MTESYVQVAADGPGKKIDAFPVVDGATDTVYRQGVVVTDGSLDAGVASVKAPSTLPTSSDGALTVTLRDAASGFALPVSGAFWQTTQPVSWSGQSVGVSGSVAVTGTFWQATQPVSIAASIPLPTGAAKETGGNLDTLATNTARTAAGSTAATAIPFQGVTGGVPVPVTGTLSASVSGFTPTPAYATLSVGSSSARVALPTGTEVVVYNTGSFDAYVLLGGSGVTATATGDVVKAGGWMAFAVGSSTYIAAVETAGATSLIISGGQGLPTGSSGGGPVTQSGAWNITNITGTVSLPTGAATSALQTTGNTTLSSIVTALGSPFQAGASIGNTTFASTQSGSWTVGATQSGAWNITNITGTVSLPTGAATSALQTTGNTTLSSILTALGSPLQAGGNVVVTSSALPTGAATSANQPTAATQGSTTSGQTGGLVMGAVTTSSPSYTTGQTFPISLDTTGNVRVTVASLPGDFAPATQNITAADVGSTSTTGQNGQTIYAGTPTGVSTASFALGGVQAVMVSITGTWTAATGIQFEVSADSGSTWVKRGVYIPGGTSNATTLFTSNVTAALLSTAGATNIRARALGSWTGTATIAVRETGTLGPVHISGTPFSSSVGSTTLPSDTALVGYSVGGTLTAAIGTSNGLKVDGSAVTQPISAASLPLPSGAATAANQTAAQAATGGAVPASAVYHGANFGGNITGLLGGQQTKANGLAVTLPSDVTASVTVSPTVTASAYSAGNIVGGLLTFANSMGAANTGVLESIYVTSKSTQTTNLKFYLFGTNPTNSTWTDKTSPSIAAADIPYLLGEYTLTGADSGLGVVTIWNLDSIGKAIKAATTSLYGILTCVGAPTLGSTSDISVTLVTLKD